MRKNGMLPADNDFMVQTLALEFLITEIAKFGIRRSYCYLCAIYYCFVLVTFLIAPSDSVAFTQFVNSTPLCFFNQSQLFGKHA